MKEKFILMPKAEGFNIPLLFSEESIKRHTIVELQLSGADNIADKIVKRKTQYIR